MALVRVYRSFALSSCLDALCVLYPPLTMLESVSKVHSCHLCITQIRVSKSRTGSGGKYTQRWRHTKKFLPSMDSDSIIAHAFGWHEEAAHADPIVVGGGGGPRLREGNGRRKRTTMADLDERIQIISLSALCVSMSTRDLQRT